MDFSLRVRLSVMMFLQYFVWGAWSVSFGTYLLSLPSEGGLNCPGVTVGLIFSTVAIGAMISPLFVGLFADRLFPAENVLAVLHLGGAAFLVWAAYTCDRHGQEIQTAFNQAASAEPAGNQNLLQALKLEKDLRDYLANPNKSGRKPPVDGNAPEALKELEGRIQPVLERVKQRPEVAGAVESASRPLFWIMLAYAIVYMPTITLTNSLSFRNLSHPDRSFGSIRVLGTIGWIVAGWVVGFGLTPISPEPLHLAARSSAVLGLFCFFLPHTPPARESKNLSDALGLPALAMLKDLSFLVLFFCSFLIMIPLAFYFGWANKFLTDIDVPYPTAVQTIGQISEILFMLLLPFGLMRLKTKGMLLLGMLAWCVRYGIFATENKLGIIALGLPLHGICYDFFFVVSYLYVDRQAPKHLRASAQGLITFITLGVGWFVGNLLGGKAQEHFSVGGTIDYPRFWLVPLGIATGATFLFFIFFREAKAVVVDGSGTKTV